MAKRKNLGNPLLIAAASSAVTNPKTMKQISSLAPYNNPQLIETGTSILKIAGLGVVGYFGYKAFKAYQQNALMQQALTDPNVKAAMDIYFAIPEGMKKGTGSLFNLFGFVDDLINKVKTIWQSTDTARLMTVAVNVTDFNQTASVFQTLYGEPLYPLLQSVLSESELQQFVNKGTSGGTVTRTSAKIRDLVFCKQPVNLRSAPDASYSGGITDIMDILKNNIVGTSKGGDFLGWILSGQQFDAKNNVWFIQTGFKVMTAAQLNAAGITSYPEWVKNALGMTYTRWVSASTDYVDIFNYYLTANTKYPLGYSTLAYLLPVI